MGPWPAEWACRWARQWALPEWALPEWDRAEGSNRWLRAPGDADCGTGSRNPRARITVLPSWSPPAGAGCETQCTRGGAFPPPGQAPTASRYRMSTGTNTDGLALQDELLPGVSRTFALTIPQLPEGLRPAVTNAYLLCRTADTIEDEVSLDPGQKKHFSDRFVAVVAGQDSAAAFAAALTPLLSSATTDAERTLVDEMPRVIGVTHNLGTRQRAAIERCVRIMCDGMPAFQRHARLSGLADVGELDRYCYYVAGVVGEMLTDLFCAYSPRSMPAARASHHSRRRSARASK